MLFSILVVVAFVWIFFKVLGLLIRAAWSQGEGRTMPKKIYEATPRGLEEHTRRLALWHGFKCCVDDILTGGHENG